MAFPFHDNEFWDVWRAQMIGWTIFTYSCYLRHVDGLTPSGRTFSCDVSESGQLVLQVAGRERQALLVPGANRDGALCVVALKAAHGTLLPNQQ